MPVALLLDEPVHAVHHPKQCRGVCAVEARQDAVRPGVALAADVHEQVRVTDGQYVRRGGLVGMGLHAGLEQHRHLGPLPRRMTGEIIAGKIRANDLQAALGQRPAAQQQRQNQNKNLAHSQNLILKFIFKFIFVL